MQSNLTQVAEVCNMWRISHDMEESFNIVMQVINFFGNNSLQFSKVSHPGAFADPDMVC
jgi:hypothetical protein